MKRSSRIHRALRQISLAAGMPAAAGGYLHAADFPVRPITLLADLVPGSATDTVARSLAADISARLGGSGGRRHPARREPDCRDQGPAAQMIPALHGSSGSAAYVGSEFAKRVAIGRIVSIPD
jgi:hypothetical protein